MAMGTAEQAPILRDARKSALLQDIDMIRFELQKHTISRGNPQALASRASSQAAGRIHRGRRSPPVALCAMADDAPLQLKDLCALLGGAAARREFLSRRTDRYIQGADFCCGRSASHPIHG